MCFNGKVARNSRKRKPKCSNAKNSSDSREVAVHVATHVWPRSAPGQMPFFPCVIRLLPLSENRLIDCLVGLNIVDIANAMGCDCTCMCVTGQ